MRFPATIGVTNIISAPADIEVPTIIGVRNNICALNNIRVFICVRYCCAIVSDVLHIMGVAAISNELPALTCQA